MERRYTVKRAVLLAILLVPGMSEVGVESHTRGRSFGLRFC